MRLIDAEPIQRELFKEADKSLAKNPYEKARICAFRRAFEMVRSTPTIEPHPNAPLTLGELCEMDGEPVWVVLYAMTLPPMWYLLNIRGDEAVNKSGGIIRLECYGDGWIAYRRKPEKGGVNPERRPE